MTKIAITSYVDNNARFVTETNLMTHSGRFLDDRFEFVLYVHPAVISQIKRRRNVTLIEYSYPQNDSFLQSYPFGRSMCFLSDILLDYDYIIKTDTDVLFTEKLNEFIFDEKIYTGLGYYMHNDTMILHLSRYAHSLGYLTYKHVGCTHSTTIGPSKDILELFTDAYRLNKTLYNTLDEGIWGETLYRDVSSMYATEIALSNYKFEILNTIDFPSDSQDDVKSVYHIHCFHVDEVYSKFAQNAGLYENSTRMAGDSVAAYCLNSYIDLRDGKDE